MANKTSRHILNASANLLGFCLFVNTVLHISSQQEEHIINELTSGVAMLLAFSGPLSFFSIKSNSLTGEKRLESCTDYLSVFALPGILIIILLIKLNFIK